MTAKEFAAAVEKYRQDKKLSFTALSKITGVGRDSFARWSRGEQEPSAEAQAKVLKALPEISGFQSASVAQPAAPIATVNPSSAITSNHTRTKTRVFLVLDDSGSMSHVAAKAQETFNRMVDDLKRSVSATGQEIRYSEYFFGRTVTRRDHDLDIMWSRPLTTYRPIQGATALFDAVLTAIDDANNLDASSGNQDSFLFIVVTDGEENVAPWKAEALRARLAIAQKTDRYTFSFMLPPGFKRSFVSRFDLPEGNVMEWEVSNRGLDVVQQNMSYAVSNYMSSRAVGVRSSKSFFTTDLSKLTTQDLQANLKDISGECKTWEVDREQDITTFVESHTKQPLVRGTAFYQLTKTEKEIQPYKQLLVMEKGKKAIYGGAAARKLLGLPEHDSVKVVPGNHANYDIFVQSTSSNRVLVRGTRVIYFPGAVQGSY